MARFTYVGPYDEVEVPGLGCVKHGESIEAGDMSKGLAEQPDNWQPVKGTSTKKES